MFLTSSTLDSYCRESSDLTSVLRRENTPGRYDLSVEAYGMALAPWDIWRPVCYLSTMWKRLRDHYDVKTVYMLRQADINVAFALTRPEWHYNTAEDKESLWLYHQILIQGLQESWR